MRFRTVTLLGLSCFAVCMLVISACDQVGNVDLPAGRAVDGGGDPTPQVVPFNLSLSANRSRLVRDDDTQGSAAITATSSIDATFAWQASDNADILDFVLPQGPGTQSVLTILGVNADPGQDDGRTVTFTVTATEITLTGEPRVVTRTITLRVVRPAASLAATVSAPGGSEIRPGASVILRIVVAGGDPVDENLDASLRIEECAEDLNVDEDCGTFAIAGTERIELSNDAESSLGLSDNDPTRPYAVAWEADENLRSPGKDVAESGTFDRVCELCLEDGETIARARYTAPEAVGSVVFKVTASDSSGASALSTQNVQVQSPEPLALAEVGTSEINLPPGKTATLEAKTAGGEPPYTIAYEILDLDSGDPIGSLDNAECTIGELSEEGDQCTTRFTASSSKDGPVRVRATITDRIGVVVSEIISLTVAAPIALDVNLIANVVGLKLGASTDIEAAIIGGTPPYSLCLATNVGSIGGLSNCDSVKIGDETLTSCICGLGNAANDGRDVESKTIIYTAPANAGGSAVIKVGVRDNVGKIASNTLGFTISNQNPGEGPDEVTVSLLVGDLAVCLGQTTDITATAAGGVTPYTYKFQLVGGISDGEAIERNGADVDGQEFDVSGPGVVQYTARATDDSPRPIQVFVSEPGLSNTNSSITITPSGLPNVVISPAAQTVCYSSTVPVTFDPEVLITDDVSITRFRWTATGTVAGVGDAALVPADVFDAPTELAAIFNVKDAVEARVAAGGGAFSLADAMEAGISFTIELTVEDKCGLVSAEQVLTVRGTVPAVGTEPVDSCDNGLVCDGVETCSSGICGGGTAKCPGLACVENNVGPDFHECVQCNLANAGDPCNDGDLCTIGDTCAGISCVGTLVNCQSFDDACNVGACSAATGQCFKDPINEGGVCNDLDECTVGDTCTAGTCDGTAAVCPVGQICDPSDGVCKGCVVNDDCFDGVACTLDLCQSGTCLGFPANVTCSIDEVCDFADGLCKECFNDDHCTSLDGDCVEGVCNTITGVCTAPPSNEGGSCDDSDPCTVTDVCTAGACGGSAKDCSGQDDQCNVGVCNPGTGVCEAQAANENNACNDGNVCTTADSCSSGVCGGIPTDCSFQDGQCVEGVCNPGTGVCEPQNANESNACNDGDLCTNGDSCTAGVCSGAAVNCSFLDDDCNLGVCDSGSCIQQATPGACNDGDFCTENDTCSGGNCSGSAVVCVGDQVCNPVDGSCTECVENVDCDDNVTCTFDGCNPNNTCSHISTCGGGDVCDPSDGDCKECFNDGHCDDGNDCTDDTCNINSGNCQNQNNSLACDAGACTVGGTCGGGVCSPGPAVDCSGTGDQCNADSTCDPNGAQDNCDVAGGAINEGNACDDSQACNSGETCQSGTCTGGAAVDCAGTGDQCNADSTCDSGGAEGNCDTPGGAINEGNACDDGQACNSGETCQSGSCTGGAAVDCAGTGDQCNADSTCDSGGAEGNCDTAGGAINEGNACDDTLACNTGETCQSGTCTGGAAVDCTGTGDECNADSTCDSGGAEGNCDTAGGTINEGGVCTEVGCVTCLCSSGTCP